MILRLSIVCIYTHFWGVCQETKEQRITNGCTRILSTLWPEPVSLQRYVSMRTVKIIEIIHSVYICFISCWLIYSIINAVQRQFFGSGVFYSVHVIICIFLALIALVLLFSHFKYKSKVNLLQILWWLPQLIVVFHNNYLPNPPEINSLYYMPFPFFIPINFSWAINQNEILIISINLVPAIIIGINLLVQIYKRKYVGTLKNKKIT